MTLEIPKLSVIFTTYNQVKWLENVLWGYEAQSFNSFEVIIGDDGSSKETTNLIQEMKQRVSYPIIHVWHEDKGFRKCDILNKAILASRADYLVFSDGDCIPRNDFLQKHFELREKGKFLSGGYYKLSLEMSNMITKELILNNKCFDLKWLKSKGLGKKFKNKKLSRNRFKSIIWNFLTTAKPTWNGHCASAWRKDILDANGFDMRMKYGGQDREFGERLVNAGIKGKQIRYSTIVLHLDHNRGYATSESINKNRKIRRETKKNKITVSKFGLKQLSN